MADLESVCKNYYMRQNSGETIKGINMNRLKLEVISAPDWTVHRDGNGDTSDTYQVQVDRHNTATAAASTIGNTNTVQIHVAYSLDRGMLKGLNTPLRVPLSGDLDVFGHSIDLNIGKSPSQVTSKIPVTVTAERQYHDHQSREQASISVHCTQKQASFRCQAKIRGKIIVQLNSGSDEIHITNIARELGSEFTRSGDELVFTVSGTCQFQLGNHENINYN